MIADVKEMTLGCQSTETDFIGFFPNHLRFTTLLTGTFRERERVRINTKQIGNTFNYVYLCGQSLKVSKTTPPKIERRCSPDSTIITK